MVVVHKNQDISITVNHKKDISFALAQRFYLYDCSGQVVKQWSTKLNEPGYTNDLDVVSGSVVILRITRNDTINWLISCSYLLDIHVDFYDPKFPDNIRREATTVEKVFTLVNHNSKKLLTTSINVIASVIHSGIGDVSDTQYQYSRSGGAWVENTIIDDWRNSIKADKSYVFPYHQMNGPETWVLDLSNAVVGNGEVREIIGDGSTITLDGQFSQKEIATTLNERIIIVLFWTGKQIIVNTIESNNQFNEFATSDGVFVVGFELVNGTFV